MKIMFKYFLGRFTLVLRNRGMRHFFILSFLMIITSTFFLSMNMLGTTYSYKIGDIANESIRVPWEIVYPLEFDTDIEKRYAAEQVPPVFEKDEIVLAEKNRLLSTFFNGIETVVTSKSSISRDEQIAILSDMLPDNLKYDKRILYSIISYASIRELRRIIQSIVNELYDKGIIDDNDFNLKIDNDTVVTVVTPSDGRILESKRRFNEIYNLKKIRNTVQHLCARYTTDIPKDQQWTVYIIVKSLIRPNLRYNAEETKKRMAEAVSKVKPVMGMLKKGHVVVREGDSITSEEFNKIQVINKYTRNIHFNYIAGIFALQCIFYFIFIFAVSPYFHKIVTDSKAAVIMSIIIFCFMAYTFFVKRSITDQDSGIIFTLLLPIPFVTMMVSILYNYPLAIISGMFAVFFAFTINGGDYASLGIAMGSALVSTFGVRNLERRTDFLQRGLLLGFVNALIAISLGLVEEYTAGAIAKNIQIAFASGIANAVIVIGLFPVFENVFGITTNFKLYELSDLNAPIFKKMLIRAPGTYNHSIMVANMAESACRAIGADYLLARVGGYYHDIGKIENSSIYIENKPNPNELVNIPPQEYCRMIISHVEKGVEIAKKNKLPQSVIDFIREHHGDSMMTFFYHQALEKAQETGDADSIHRSLFRYPGPKPHTRESAVVMLADSVEAASRSVHEPTYAKLETLVKNIISTKLGEGDLEHSELTMQDLTGIQKAFLQILNGIFHTRIEYPQAEAIKKLEQKVAKNACSN